jgi:two-component system response regulator GlrR
VPRLILIGDGADESRCDLVNLLSAGGQYDCTEFARNKVRWEDLASASADLIVAITGSDPDRAIDLVGGLSPVRAHKTYFGILPKEIDGGVLEAVSGLVDDFVLWPSSRAELVERIRRLVGSSTGEKDDVAKRLLREIGFNQLVGEDPAFLCALEKIPVMAETTFPVLIAGETGTGKEFCARAIHYLGKRPDHAFVPVDCGAIPDHVFENEMYGHVRGGYTDAHSDQKGLAELAHGGTLFLDEVDSLSTAAQSKLLRFLQERTFKPLGASKFVTVDVRIIAASNQDLERCVQGGRFRADLFYRLSALRLRLPPLRERPLDIAILARHFLAAMGPSRNGARRAFAPSSLRKLNAHAWPGNVRELQNIVQQAALLAPGPQILPEHLPFLVGDEPPLSPATFRVAKARAVEAFEREYVEELLRNSNGNVTHAAKEANRDRRSIGRLIKKYNINRNSV